MGTTERREREREEIRKKILDAARELFASEGYERVTMRRIAEAIEYSPTTIYNHFEDKDDLVHSLCEEDFARLLGALKRGEPPADPVEWIRQLGTAYVQFALAQPNHYRFMFMTPAKFEEKRELVPSGEMAFGLLRSAVEKAVQAGMLRPGSVDTMSQILWSNVHGVAALLITLRPEHWPCAPVSPDLVAQAIENGIRGLTVSTSERR